MKKQKKTIAILFSVLFLIIVIISVSGCSTLKNVEMKKNQINSLVSKNRSLAYYTKTVYKGLKISISKNPDYQLIRFNASPLGGFSYAFGKNIIRLYSDYCNAIGDNFNRDFNIGYYFKFYNKLHNYSNGKNGRWGSGYYTWAQFACKNTSGLIDFAMNIVYNYIPDGNHVNFYYIALAKPTYIYAKRIKSKKIKFLKNYLKFYQGNFSLNNLKFNLNLIPAKNNVQVKKINLGFFKYPYYKSGPKTLINYVGKSEYHYKYPLYNMLRLNIYNNSHKPYVLNLSTNKTIKNLKTGNVYEILPMHNKKIRISGSECAYLNDNEKLLINPLRNCSIYFATKIPGFLFSFNKSAILYFGKLRFDLKPVSEYDLKDKR